MRRLPLCPVDVQRVARAAPCCAASVVRWLHGVAGNAGTDKLIRAALLELDLHPVRQDPLAAVDRETAQLVMAVVAIAPANPPATPLDESGNGGQIPSVAGRQPPKRLVGDSPNMGQPGEFRSCPVGLDDCTSPTPTLPAGRSATFASIAPPAPPVPRCTSKSRCRVTIIGPDGQVMVDEVTL